MAYVVRDSSGGTLTPWLKTPGGLVELTLGGGGPIDPPDPTLPDPVAWYDFHEGAGSATAADTMGAYPSLVTSDAAGAWSGTKVTGGSAGFTWQDDSGPGPISSTTEWTVSLKISITSLSGWRYPLNMVAAGGTQYFWVQDGSMSYYSNASGGITGAQLTANVESTLAWVYDGSVIKLYKDGILGATSGAASIATPYANMSSSSSVWPSQRGGTVDDLRFWDSALTDEQIAAL